VPLSGERPTTRFVESEGGYLAYQALGSGERDILFITGGLSNIDAMWDEPSAVRFMDRLTRLGRVVQYDMRGSGVSDPVPDTSGWLPLEAYVRDALTVMDEVAMPRAIVYGDTEGGLTAQLLAATHPDRVSALVLVNSEARFLRADDYPIGMPRHVAEAFSQQYQQQHGTTGAVLELTAPTAAADPRFRSWWVRYQRASVPLGVARRTFDWFAEIDVRAALPLIQAPTLVVARREGRFHSLRQSQYLAEHIPGATLRVVDGADTLPFHAGDFHMVLDEVEEFLTGNRESVSTDRALATVLFTDIVGSTQQAALLGDEAWVDVLGEHDRRARAQLDRFDGRLIKTTGDGFVATFDGPSRGVSCAIAVSETVRDIGLTVRAGLHVGEVQVRDEDIGGLAVHVAARVMDQARTGGIVVSSTVKDLIVGSGIEVIERGTTALAGVPGEWTLFDVPVA
jgi:class 3 adenylate cyclase/pimeloyl-ACP methyl ester carboxylesterase